MEPQKIEAFGTSKAREELVPPTEVLTRVPGQFNFGPEVIVPAIFGPHIPQRDSSIGVRCQQIGSVVYA